VVKRAKHVVPTPRIERRFVDVPNRCGVKRRVRIPQPSHDGILRQFCDARTPLRRTRFLLRSLAVGAKKIYPNQPFFFSFKINYTTFFVKEL
jgi:hypothetical protein